MAIFTELNESYLPQDGDWYKVDGIITEEDIERINSFPRKTILVIDNTKGLSSDIVSRITSNNITFSVVGGIDYFNKEKYKNKDYISRTMMSPTGLTEVIKYYEEIESKMSSEWTDTQKCMFLYDAIVRDFTYEENYNSKIKKGTAERSLNGVLYKKLVCAGFALAFKEGLDRIGIENVYQNRKGHHSWNVVKLDGDWRGLELTWDCSNKGADNVCQFRYFGQNKDFYGDKHHTLSTEVEDINWDNEEVKINVVHEEEVAYDIVPFSVEELKANYSVIEPTVNSREVNQSPLFKNEEEELQMSPLDKLRLNYQEQCEAEKNFILLNMFLENSNQLESSQYGFLKIRKAFCYDILGSLSTDRVSIHSSHFTGKDIGIDSLSRCEFDVSGDYSAPFGTRRSIAGEVVRDEIVNEGEKNEAFDLLKKQLHDYSISYLTGTLNNSEALLSSYNELRNLNIKKDFNLSILEADLYTRLKSLTLSKTLLLESGISPEIVEQKIGQIEDYFDSIKQKDSIFTEEDKRKNDLDFLYGVFDNPNEIRKICEAHDECHYTDYEWKQKCTDVDYMLEVFDKLPELNIEREYIQEVLNNVFLEPSDYTDDDSYGGK